MGGFGHPFLFIDLIISNYISIFTYKKKPMKIDAIMSEYTNGFIDVEQLVKKYPNDMDLGREVRKLINEMKEAKPTFPMSHLY